MMFRQFLPLPLGILCIGVVHAALSVVEPGSSTAAGDPSLANLDQAQADQVAGQQLNRIQGPARAAGEAFLQGKFEEGVKIARPLAEKGDPDALFLMALAHEGGKGVDLSRDKALQLHRRAATKGHQDASLRVALLLLTSELKNEREEARTLLETMAKKDVTVAGRILGEAWLSGRLSDKPNAAKAIEWWARSAAAGDLTSIRTLAGFYEGRLGFPELKDLKEAYKLYAKAADGGDAGSMLTLGSRLLLGEESMRDEKRGREWLEKAVAAGEFTACLVLGDYEENVRRDAKAALAAYERGKDGGQVDCMFRAAGFYLQGLGVKKDEARGKALMVKAAQSGHPQAQFTVAMTLMGADQPDLGAIYLNLLASANSNYGPAQNELGLLYLTGKMGVADQTAGVGWLTRAAKLGSAAAQNNLGTLYEAGGGGLKQDYTNAVELYSLAAKQGHMDATRALIRLFSQGPIELNLPRAWALASIAVERGDESVKDVRDQVAAKLSKDQRAKADTILSDLKKAAAPSK